MKGEEVYRVLEKHLPAQAIAYCFKLWEENPFQFKITRSRQTKVGDFMHRRGVSQITVNRDCNPYLFLVTYVHEVAHHHVHMRRHPGIDPHGMEWKCTFKDLMMPLLRKDVFPDEILHVLARHMENPKASSFADAELTRAFRLFDPNASNPSLSDLPEGSIFEFQKRVFQKGKAKRTRIVCRELKSKRNYLIPGEVVVTNVQLSLL